MAYHTGRSDRVDDMRFRNPQSPRDEGPFPTYTPPLRSIGSQLPAQNTLTNDARQSLVRRFTTNTVPTLPTLSTMSPLSPIGQQRRQAAESTDLSSAVRTTWQKKVLLPLISGDSLRVLVSDVVGLLTLLSLPVAISASFSPRKQTLQQQPTFLTLKATSFKD